jgi:chemotaxis protein MotB
MNRRPRTYSPGRDRWMISYLDVLTILLIFFLTAAAKGWKSMAPISQPSTARPLLPLTPPPPPSAVELNGKSDDTGESRETVSDPDLTGIERRLKQQGFDVRDLTDAGNGGNYAGGRGLSILLPQAVLFAPGDDRIRSAALAPLQQIAAALRDVPNKVNLAGHADATPIHNLRFRNNWELAAARSLRLMEALTERYGIDETRVSISSYGSLEPKGPNDTTGGRASNRRVEILILSKRPRSPTH